MSVLKKTSWLHRFLKEIALTTNTIRWLIFSLTLLPDLTSLALYLQNSVSATSNQGHTYCGLFALGLWLQEGGFPELSGH